MATAGETPQPLGAAGAWTLRFDDEFRGTTLNAAKWQPDWLAVNNTTVTPPVNVSDVDCTDPGAVQVSGGILHLRAAARSCTASNGRTYPFASGLVNTHNSFTFTHGFMEARIDVPATSAGTPANFPAFWADGTGTWPTSGELDVMEVNGNCGPGEGFHFHSSAGAFGGCSGLRPAPGWHTFGADWQPSGVSYYYDGHLVGRLTTGITSTPMYLVLDNNVDPTWGGPSLAPADLQVDYVRVWQ